MNLPPSLIVGLLLATGFAMGRLAARLGFPTVTGYILAGLLLNPGVLPVMPPTFPEHTDLVTNVALAFITFEVGGSLTRARMRKLGATILSMVFFEAEFAVVAATLGTLAWTWWAGAGALNLGAPQVVAFCVLVGSLASPTDPSATLAVVHEYKAEGPVTSAVLGVAAFDDAIGVVNYSLCMAFARFLMGGAGTGGRELLGAFGEIGGGVLLGVACGLLLNALASLLSRVSEGGLMVVVLAALSLAFGLARYLHTDELLATMTMGAVVVNTNPVQHRIFELLQRYTEELVFVLFFTLSGMHLRFSGLGSVAAIIPVYVGGRAAGKFLGAFVGARLGRASPTVRRYTGLGLIPQGGIVVGLALLMRSDPVFAPFSGLLVNLVIGATLIHEIVGPILSKTALQLAGEVHVPGEPPG
ncbi:MAG: cation:proton antiporter [Deferrisomatales bacterium]